MDSVVFSLTCLATLGCGLMAGIFLIFSNTIMAALGRLPAAQAIAAMQAINRVILNPLFLLIFMGTALVCVLLAGSLCWRRPTGVIDLLAGALLYLVGVIGVTMRCNVPLNEALDKVDPESIAAATLWADYLRRWTAWNHVRTVAALLGTAAFVLGLQ